MNPRRGVPPLTRTEMTFLVTYATCTEAPFLVPRLKEEQIRQIMYFRTTPLLQIIPSEYLVRNYFTTIRENKQSVATKWQNTSYSRPSTVFWQFQWCTWPAAFCPAAKKNWGTFKRKSLCTRHFDTYLVIDFLASRWKNLLFPCCGIALLWCWDEWNVSLAPFGGIMDPLLHFLSEPSLCCVAAQPLI